MDPFDFRLSDGLGPPSKPFDATVLPIIVDVGRYSNHVKAVKGLAESDEF